MLENEISRDGYRVDDFIDRTNAVESIPSLLALFTEAVASYGYPYFALGALTRQDIYQLPTPSPQIAITYPQTWTAHYFESNYMEIDPIVLKAPSMHTPFLWNDFQHLTRRQKIFFDEAAEAGLRNGIVLPVHGPVGDCFVASMVSDGEAAPDRFKSRLFLLSTQFHQSYLRLVSADNETPSVILTKRERECLTWSARGKSSWEISVILHLSNYTVDEYLKTAIAKFGTTSRIMAIVRAIRLGLINP